MVDTFFAGEIAVELLKELAKLCHRTCSYKSKAEQLKHSINSLLPIIQEIQYSGVELPQHRQSQLDELARKLRQGIEVARLASSSSRFNVYKNLQLTRRMEKVEKSVSKFLTQLPAHVLADVHHVRVEMGERMERFERRLEDRLGAFTIGEGNEKRVFEEEEEKFGGGALEGGGLRIGVEKVKEMVISPGGDGGREVRVVGVCGIGGSGKTTLVKEICKDYQIRSESLSPSLALWSFGDLNSFQMLPNFLNLRIWNLLGFYSGNIPNEF